VTNSENEYMQTKCVYRPLKNNSLVKISTLHPLSELSLGNISYKCDFCHTLVQGETVISQGCWTPGDGCDGDCRLTPLVSTSLLQRLEPGSSGASLSELKFCCCSGEFCNQNWAIKQKKTPQNYGSVNKSYQFFQHPSTTELVLLIIVIILSIIATTLIVFLVCRCPMSQRKVRPEQISIMNEFSNDKISLLRNIS